MPQINESKNEQSENEKKEDFIVSAGNFASSYGAVYLATILGGVGIGTNIFVILERDATIYNCLSLGLLASMLVLCFVGYILKELQRNILQSMHSQIRVQVEIANKLLDCLMMVKSNVSTIDKIFEHFKNSDESEEEAEVLPN